MFGVGVWLFVATTRARDRIGAYALWAFVVLLDVSAALGPPPPSPRVLALASLAGVLLPLWAGWLGRHRSVAIGRS